MTAARGRDDGVRHPGAVRVTVDPASRGKRVAIVEPSVDDRFEARAVVGDRTVGVGLETIDGVRAAVTVADAAAGPDGGAGERTVVLLMPPEPDRSGGVRREVVVAGWSVTVTAEPERRASLRERARRGAGDAGPVAPSEIRAVIPGRVLAVSVAPGDQVSAGQPLLVVEAMKMQNQVRAPRDGTVRDVAASPGATVELGDLLVVIE